MAPGVRRSKSQTVGFSSASRIAPHPFILFRDDFAAREVLFDEPRDIILANDPDEFFPALAAAEKARADGKWLAGYFSYEAGYLFEPKLRPLLPAGRRTPLMCFGVFDGPSEREVPRERPVTNGAFFGVLPSWSFQD